MVSKSALFNAALWGVVTAGFLGHYYTNTETDETALLRATAEYIDEYDGSTANQALDYIESSVESVAENLDVAEVSELEAQIGAVDPQLRGTTSIIYEPVLESIGDSMDSIANQYGRNSEALACGLVSGIGFLSFLGMGLYLQDSWRE